MNGAWTMYMGVGVSENGGSPSQHGCFNTNSWSNDLDDDWGYPHFRKPAYIYNGKSKRMVYNRKSIYKWMITIK